MKKRISRVIFSASLVLNAVFLAAGGYLLYEKGGLSYILNKVSATAAEQTETIRPYSKDKYDLFKYLEPQEDGIVFLGDSLTDYNEWSEMFPEHNILNRGIGGETTDLLLNRIDEVIERKPSKVFIMMGINDIGNGKNAEEIMVNYKKLVEDINENSPETSIYIQSVLPVNNKRPAAVSMDNNEIVSLNELLAEYSYQTGVSFIDVHAEVVAENIQLNENYTTDGLHLNSEGYRIWKDTINEYVVGK